jgi:putative ABC transport system ATP-binding protein
VTLLVELDAVTRTYRAGRGHVVAVDAVSLTLAPGELVCVMGPSGCGKSTLLALAGGLEEPDEGQVRLDGRPLAYTPVERGRRLREEVGFVFQELNLLPNLTALENVALPLELGGTRRRDALRAARLALAQVGADADGDVFPSELSGGEQQRVAVARALIGQRQILLADEPTGALDSLAAEELMRIIRSRCNAGAGAIVATHDPARAAIADRVVFLRDGAIVGETVAEPDRVGAAR